MPMSASQATQKYRNGIDGVGIDAYRQASNTNSPAEAARILERNSTENALSLDRFASAYRQAYDSGAAGGGGTMG